MVPCENAQPNEHMCVATPVDSLCRGIFGLPAGAVFIGNVALKTLKMACVLPNLLSAFPTSFFIHLSLLTVEVGVEMGNVPQRFSNPPKE